MNPRMIKCCAENYHQKYLEPYCTNARYNTTKAWKAFRIRFYIELVRGVKVS